jgi:type II restriction/modification system DNA methylase subunit YeeA
MNKANLKSYAPQARKDFIAAVTARANQLGLSNKAGSLEIASAEKQGDVTVIAGQAWPAKIKGQRDKLIERIQKDGFNHTMEAVAYTWFNRFAALRYMEIHDYLGHGHRALSSTSGGLPDILANATDLASELPGLNAAKVMELKLAGNRDGELYRMLLVAQCNALSRAMPFLFERIDDDSELLLPDNLLRSDSVITKLVTEIPEEDWAEVEIIGWLYQFYISEKKDQVIGKVVKSEDIPAATQLFTPNWIVQYLVQNSVGRLWLVANPQSTLAKEWPYYITPAEQTPEVQAQLDALIQTRVKEDGETVNPESITVLDPACGSGHILVVAYDVLKAIYLERGYQPRTIPRLILEKNLFGLDIDDRAAQMAGFALLMKARADDRRLFTATDDAGILQPPKLNVLSLQESKGLNVDDLANNLAPFKVDRTAVALLVDAFEHAKTFGSLIQISQTLSQYLAFLPEALSLAKLSGDIYASAAADDLLPLVQQAQMLAMQFDAVVANPPYMGSKFHIPMVKAFLRDEYKGFEKDLFAAFMLRNAAFAKPGGEVALMTSNVWMSLSSYDEVRKWLLEDKSLQSLVHLSNSGFEGAMVFVCAFQFTNIHIKNNLASFVRLTEFSRADEQGPKTLEALKSADCEWLFRSRPDNFKIIPGSPVVYWLSEKMLSSFEKMPALETLAEPKQGATTSDNNRFLRQWYEVDQSKLLFGAHTRAEALASERKWFPYNKGGAFRRWAGNFDFVINYANDGQEIKEFHEVLNLTSPGGRLKNQDCYFLENVSWSKISSGDFSARYFANGFIFDVAGSALFTSHAQRLLLLCAALNSRVAHLILKALSPTLNYEAEHIRKIPIAVNEVHSEAATVEQLARQAIGISIDDWNLVETSWDFGRLGLIQGAEKLGSLSKCWQSWQEKTELQVQKLQSIEYQNNQIFIAAYGLENELSPEPVKDQITLVRADREKDCQRLISYAIGCMMGRYSLDGPGLIYAHAGNFGFDSDRYKTFPADADGIVPITDDLWFGDDASLRIREFLLAVWGSDTLEENMVWLAESLGAKANETPDETIRRYIADKFFKDHLQTYKKRPIYWLFSSGKQGAFQALVYLHRYSEGTVARMRAEYVVPLTNKIQNRIEMIQKDAAAASTTAARNKLNKEVESLKKKHIELLAYDEKLRHYADMRITLDLDDGVKVNYGKFGDLLSEVKAVTGGASDD